MLKIVGFMVCGPGEADRYLKRSLDEFKRLCDDVMIACNNTDPQTEELITSYGFKWYRDDREWGKYQPMIKTRLLQRIATLNPTHILPLDSDEVFIGVERKDLEEMSKNYGTYFFILNLWNAEDRYIPQLSFWNIRFYKFDPRQTQFINKPVHPGLAPLYAYQAGVYAPFFVKHFGLMNPADRRKKVARYEKYDPNAVHKGSDYYNALKSKSEGVELDISSLQLELNTDVKKMGKQKRSLPTPTNMKYYYVKRLKDGKILDIPERDLQRTLATKNFELIGDAIATEETSFVNQAAPAPTTQSGFIYMAKDGSTIDVLAKDEKYYLSQGWKRISGVIDMPSQKPPTPAVSQEPEIEVSQEPAPKKRAPRKKKDAGTI